MIVEDRDFKDDYFDDSRDGGTRAGAVDSVLFAMLSFKK